MTLHIVILAAGQGKRMYSKLPKVLHPLAGKPMLQRVIETAISLNPQAIHVVYGHEGPLIREKLHDLPVHWVEQKELLGTGHALMQTLPFIAKDSQVMVLYGDVPLITQETLESLLQLSTSTPRHALSLLVANLDNPAGLGRIVRDTAGNIIRIVEDRDATEAEKRIQEIYTGICAVNVSDLQRWLPALTNHNSQNEYFLTDIIAMAQAENCPLLSVTATCHQEISGVNNRLQLHTLERSYQQSLAEKLLLSGTTLADASRLDIRGELICGQDVFIDVNCLFQGKVVLGDGCRIGPNCVLTEVTLGKNTEILPHSVLEGSHIAADCKIGPFARLRPGTQLADHCKIGNFVEIKNVHCGEHSKAGHLSYLGDAAIGQHVNIGAGTIICNYDGANKHHTTIEDHAHIGSGTQLVAPVTISANATIGAGSTIRKHVPPDGLTVTEAKQKFVATWKRPVKSER